MDLKRDCIEGAADVGSMAMRRMPYRAAESALRSWVAVPPLTAAAMIAAALAGSWVLSYLVGGAGTVVPHWYYAPIMFAAARFGIIPALMVAVASGVLAGPLTYLDVASATAQDTGRWLTRLGFFVGGAVGMSALVRPSMPSILATIRERREERRVREALDNGELFLRYQPIFQLGTQHLYGFEALIRWQHPELGELGPDAILPAAERSDVIRDLGLFVLREACESQVGWAQAAQERGEPPPCLAVNMSAVELESPDLIAGVRDVLVETGVDPRQVCVEITESVLVNDFDLSVARLAGLRTLGVRIAVDDFGTGYSSLAAVHRFPIDVVKIDREFIAGLDKYENTAKLIGGLVLLARALDLTVVAEGIETESAAQTLSDLHVGLGQGFLFEVPLGSEDAHKFAASARMVDLATLQGEPLKEAARTLNTPKAAERDKSR